MKLKDNELLDIMLASRKCGMTTMMHAENGDIINWLTGKPPFVFPLSMLIPRADRLEEKGMLEPVYHGWSRPPIVEAEATNRAITLAELVDQPILFVHVSAAEAANTIRKAQTRGVPIFAETCPQYLYLSWQDLVSDTPCRDKRDLSTLPATLPRPGLLREQQARLLTAARSGWHRPGSNLDVSGRCPSPSAY